MRLFSQDPRQSCVPFLPAVLSAGRAILVLMTSNRQRLSSKKGVDFALGFTALVAGVLGGGMWYASVQAREEAALVESLPEQGAEALRGRSAGQAVLVSGTLAADNPVLFRRFVAYLHYEPHRERSSKSTRTDWRVRQRFTPPLWVETATGRVLVRNDTYALGAATGEPSELAERGSSAWLDDEGRKVWEPSRPSSGPQWYTGFEPGQGVVVLGTVARGGDAPELEATRVFGGSRAELVSSARGAATLFRIFAFVLTPISLAALVALVVRLARRR